MIRIGPNLKGIRDIKEDYMKFNDEYVGEPKRARKGLEEIIKKYRNCRQRIFKDITESLQEHFEEIINSFIVIKKYKADDVTLKRLSNGPMESLNRIPKDMKRNARGYRNFEHIRNRFLFYRRKNAEMLCHPKSWKEGCFSTGIKRVPYKKAAKGPKLKK